jgi:hypothetical protein
LNQKKKKTKKKKQKKKKNKSYPTLTRQQHESAIEEACFPCELFRRNREVLTIIVRAYRVHFSFSERVLPFPPG